MLRSDQRRPARRASTAAAAAIALFALGACGGGSGDAAARIGAEVAISDVLFTPADVTVNAGDAVRWTNTSATERHNILPVVDSSFKKHDALIKNREQVTIRFTKPGEYAYYCSIHGSPTGGQRGIVRVVGTS